MESANLTKKELAVFKKRQEKLEKFFGGVKNMSRLPDAVVIIDQIRERKAVRECIKLNIPLITLMDSNCDPNLTKFFIFGNDDSLTSVQFLLNQLIPLILKGQNNL